MVAQLAEETPLPSPAGTYLRATWRDADGASKLSAGWRDYTRSTRQTLVLRGAHGESVSILYTQLTAVQVPGPPEQPAGVPPTCESMGARRP